MITNTSIEDLEAISRGEPRTCRSNLEKEYNTLFPYESIGSAALLSDFEMALAILTDTNKTRNQEIEHNHVMPTTATSSSLP